MIIPVANRLHTVEEYYFSKKLKEVRQMNADGNDVINIGIGSPDFEPLPEVVKQVQQSMNDEGAHQYQSYQGISELRKAIASFYSQQFSVSLNYNEEVLPLMGSKEGIMHISLAFLNPGDKVLIPNPGYPTYSSVTKLVQAQPLYYDLTPETNWLPVIEQLNQYNLNDVKIMWINYPHMPTGAKASKEHFKKLVHFAKDNNILLVNDNPYSFVLNNEPLSLLSVDGAKDVAIELNSMSKTFNMAGWRIGMALAKKDYIHSIVKVKSNMDSGMFYPLQKGAVRALQASDEWYRKLNEKYAQRRNKIFMLCDLLNCTYDKHTAGMFVWAKLPEQHTNSEEFIESILQQYFIFITPGSIFGNNGNGFIRFSLCVPSSRIEEAINRIKAAKK